MNKTILVLANSIKGGGGRCVAGIEIVNKDLKNPVFGKWIRPIDKTQREGTLKETTTCISHAQVSPLDVIEVDFSENAQDITHPEDWIINNSTEWRHLGRYESTILNKLSAGNWDRWGDQKGITPGQYPITLQLIKLQKDIKVSAYHSHNPWKDKMEFKRRAQFDCYDCGVTDPQFSHKHWLYSTRISQNEVKHVIVKEGSYVVLSLTPPIGNKNLQYRVYVLNEGGKGYQWIDLNE